MRAMSQNREACAVVGVDVQRVALATFAAVGRAGRRPPPRSSRRCSTSSPTWAPLLTLKAFAAVVAGGFGYVNGAIAASFLIGITEALAGSYISYAYKDAIAFLVMIAVLLWRPQGLFGRRIGI